MKANYSHYYVSEEGDVTDINNGNIVPKNIHCTGYYYLYLDTPEGYKNISLHRVVATVYIPNLRNLPVVRHKNDNKLDCHYTNLQWGSQQDNIMDSIDKIREGAAKHRKLTDDDIVYIRTHYIKGDSQFSGKALAKKFGVRQQYISTLINHGVNCTR